MGGVRQSWGIPCFHSSNVNYNFARRLDYCSTNSCLSKTKRLTSDRPWDQCWKSCKKEERMLKREERRTKETFNIFIGESGKLLILPFPAALLLPPKANQATLVSANTRMESSRKKEPTYIEPEKPWLEKSMISKDCWKVSDFLFQKSILCHSVWKSPKNVKNGDTNYKKLGDLNFPRILVFC